MASTVNHRPYEGRVAYLAGATGWKTGVPAGSGASAVVGWHIRDAASPSYGESPVHFIENEDPATDEWAIINSKVDGVDLTFFIQQGVEVQTTEYDADELEHLVVGAPLTAVANDSSQALGGLVTKGTFGTDLIIGRQTRPVRDNPLWDQGYNGIYLLFKVDPVYP